MQQFKLEIKLLDEILREKYGRTFCKKCLHFYQEVPQPDDKPCKSFSKMGIPIRNPYMDSDHKTYYLCDNFPKGKEPLVLYS